MPRLRASALVLLVLVLVAAGCGATKTETVTVTQTRTATVTAPPPGLPGAVAKTHAQLLAAAETGDYEKLRPLVPARGFQYSFGGAFPGGAIAYWKNVEATTDQRPIEALASILQMPYTLNRGIYIWPFAYDKTKSDLTAYERGLLGPLVES
ncbi:MAG: hypothetical protein M3540_08850 [Actinomycetota bacterium]|nr:hypothetical protein [Actinomycetota bacterium]